MDTMMPMEDRAPYESMGPSLLARQPVTDLRMEEALAELDWGLVFDRMESRLGALRNWRYSWWWHWSRLAEFFLPRRYVWLVVANRMWRGAPINDQIIDSTGGLAVRTCSAGMWTGLTSPSRPWFEVGIGNPGIELDAEGKAWLSDATEKARDILNASNFYQIMAQAFQDVTVFGTAPVIMYEDDEDVIRCYLPCAGEYYLDVGARLSVDTMLREFTLNVMQIVDMFNVENCPSQVVELWNRGGASLSVEFVICHAIEPNFAFNVGDRMGAMRFVPGHFTWREVYWLKGMRTPKPLSKKGFNEQPFFAARWATTSNDPYGRSPCMDALGDQKQIQLETRRKGEFIEKGVRPPMVADPSLKNEPSSIIPGMITYTSTGGAGFKPIFEVNEGWIKPLSDDIDKVSARIEKCLFVDLFMAITRMEGVQPRNELELTQRNLERLQELGPFVQMFENEFAGPAIRRLMQIMVRRKLLKPLPKSLRGVPLKINYISIMKLAMSASESVSIKDVLSTGGALSSAAHAAGLPDPLRVIDLDKALRRYADLNNFPDDCLFTVEEVQQQDKVRAKQQAAAQAPANAMAAVTAAKTLSETNMGGGNALGAMLGQQGGGAPQ